MMAHSCFQSMEDPWHPIVGGVTAPSGFKASGVAAGLKPSGERDLAVVVAPPGASCAGVFTRNQVRAACVDLCAERLQQTGGQAQAVIINAGQANACTGGLARVDSERITEAMARWLDLAPTMLAFITCDVGVDPQWWHQTLQGAMDSSFHAITVDGDTSTNDTVLAFAAGQPISEEHLPLLAHGVERLCCALAKAVARDGEGATCLLSVQVRGTATPAEARTMARAICGSSLVKTAIHGRDPNWGRIVAAAGRSGVPLQPEAIDLWIGPHQMLKDGQPLGIDRAAVSRYLQERADGAYLQDDCVEIGLSVGPGPALGSAWGCDLSAEYIRINAHYTT